MSYKKFSVWDTIETVGDVFFIWSWAFFYWTGTLNRPFFGASVGSLGHTLLVVLFAAASFIIAWSISRKIIWSRRHKE